MPSTLDLVFFVWAAISTIAFFVSAYKVAYYTTHTVEEAKKVRLWEATEQWNSPKYQMQAYRWKMRRWYLAWFLAPVFIALFWLPAIPAFAGHNLAKNEKKEREALEEAQRTLQEYYEKAEIEAAKAAGREPILDLSHAIPNLVKANAT